MSVINRMEVSNCINLDNYRPNQKDWSPHYPYLEINFRGLSAAIKATNGTGKTTLNNAYYALVTRDRSMTSKFKSRMAPKRKGVWSHFRLEMLYQTMEDNLRGPQLFGIEAPGEAWVFGMYGYSDDEVRFYCYRGHFEDCPLAIKEGHKRSLVHNEEFASVLKSMTDANTSLTVSDWKKAIGRHIDESLTQKMLAYHKAGGGDGTDNFFKVDSRAGEDYDTAFFYSHIAPETLVDCMGSYAEDDERGFEDTLLKSAREVITARYEVDKSAKKIEKLTRTHGLLSAAKGFAEDHSYAQEQFEKQAQDVMAEYHFLRQGVVDNPLPLLPIVMSHNHSQSQVVANSMVLQDGHWLFPDYVLSQLVGSESKVINQLAFRKGLTSETLRRSQVIEIPCDLMNRRREDRGKPGRAYSRQEALTICRESTSFAEGWSQDAALRAINYAWDWRTGEGEHNIFRKLRQESETHIEALGQEIDKDEANWEKKNGELQHLNSEIQGIEQAELALSAMRQSQLFDSEELASPFTTGRQVHGEYRKAVQDLRDLDDQNVALEDGRKSYARIVQEFGPQSPVEAFELLNATLENAETAASNARHGHENAREDERQAGRARLAVQDDLEGLRNQKGEIDYLAPYMRKYESSFPGENPCELAESVPNELQDARSLQARLEVEVGRAKEVCRGFEDLEPGIQTYRSIFNDEAPQGLAEAVTRALSDAEHEIEWLASQQEQASDKLTELTEGQRNLTDTRSRFGQRVDLKTLEAELEERENLARATLMKAEQSIDRLAPMVADLEVFEQTFPNSSPHEVLRHRGERRNRIAVEINRFQVTLRITNNQIAGLEFGGSAPGRIGSEVLECVGEAPLLVHQVIKDMALSGDRENAVMAHFSHVLHSPVYADVEEAGRALTRLDEAGLEVPIFSLEGLHDFCRDGDLFSQGDSVRGLLAGMHTPQVKALLDPSLVPDLIQGLQEKASDIERELSCLETELADLGPDSEISHTISRALQAIQEEARIALVEAREQYGLTSTELETVQAHRSVEVIRCIRLAADYVEAGGDLALEQQKTEVSRLRQKFNELNLELPTLKARASEAALAAIQAMLEFLKLGGAEARDRNVQVLRNSTQALTDIQERLPTLRFRYEQLPIITSAKRFIELGGWVEAQALDSHLNEAEGRLSKAQQAESDARARVEQTEALVKSTNSQLIEASKAASTWKGDLARAIEFEKNDGVSFDASFGEKRQSRLEAVERADKRTRFQFDQAQQAIDAENDPFFRDNKVKQRDELADTLSILRTRLTDRRKDQDDARAEVEVHRRSLDKADAAAKRVLDQWKAVRKITADLPIDQTAAAISASNVFVEDSLHIASDLREAFAEERWADALEKLDDLAENAESFPLSKRQQTINELTKVRQTASNNLKKEVRKILDMHDNGLSEGEVEALSVPPSEADLTRSVLDLYRLIDSHLVKAEEKHRLNEQDVEANKQRMLDSMAGFTGNAQDNFDLLKRVMSTRGGGASIKVSGTVIGAEGMRETLNSLVDEIDTQLSRRREDLESGRGAKESEHAFSERLREMIRSEFYRAAFRAPEATDSSGPRVYFNHPQIGGGRDIPLSRDVSTGQYNALTLLILVKLADFSMRRDARNEFDGLAITRAKRLLSARTVMIDGLFSNLSDKKMIRESLSVLRSLKGSFQLIGWIHNQQYDNDYELFPACVSIRRTGLKRGYVLAEEAGGPPLPETEEVAALEAHITPMAIDKVNNA
ncbi:hypothetical protein EB809_18790 [Marinobacter sp. R17]|uniref:hypothetical protein n=1 Tax=Marinobacter sp. R17 TaxID=2484250 RepID=UPI000F4BB213|nr:hypothetical protein [Marinobacter sp. R17]ROT94725.1 hypothetical protein EB809_18790 [Marinobacter sp. R17]